MMKLLLLLPLVALVSGHGWLKYPVSRTSIQLYESEFGTSQPYWWDHTGVWCGNVQQDMQYSTCGRCGEAPGNSDASQGGMYYKGVIVANWTAGSIVEVVAELTAPHNGQYHIELCSQETETDNCFVRLPIVGGSEQVRIDNSICVVKENVHEVKARVQLPAGVRCSRCTIRWTYRTNYPGQPWYPEWTPCDVKGGGPTAGVPTQVFRGCADVRIN